MRAGDVLNGYTLLADFSVVGAGLSRWTFASKGGREYFVKEFLSPTYPEADAPGSERIKAKKRERCAAFETFFAPGDPGIPMTTNRLQTDRADALVYEQTMHLAGADSTAMSRKAAINFKAAIGILRRRCNRHGIIKGGVLPGEQEVEVPGDLLGEVVEHEIDVGDRAGEAAHLPRGGVKA